MTTLRSPLSRARNHGSARSGAHHWWMQKLTAAALIPLGVLLAALLIFLLGSDHQTVVVWVGNPIVAALMMLFVGVALYHAVLGMQVVYEDYIHNKWIKIFLDVGTKFFGFLLGAIALFSLVRLAFLSA